jgi:hypothetical protein
MTGPLTAELLGFFRAKRVEPRLRHELFEKTAACKENPSR